MAALPLYRYIFGNLSNFDGSIACICTRAYMLISVNMYDTDKKGWYGRQPTILMFDWCIICGSRRNLSCRRRGGGQWDMYGTYILPLVYVPDPFRQYNGVLYQGSPYGKCGWHIIGNGSCNSLILFIQYCYSRFLDISVPSVSMLLDLGYHCTRWWW